MTHTLHWLLYGGRGWIGQQLVDTVRMRRPMDIVTLGAARADDEVAVLAEMRRIVPDRVVSLVGRTSGPGVDSIDYLQHPDRLVDNVRDNLYAPLVLAQHCADMGVHFTYVGTGCIFQDEDASEGAQRRSEEGASGECAVEFNGAPFAARCSSTPLSARPFTEQDTPNYHGSHYSCVKGVTDRLFHLLFDSKALNVRIRMPVAADRHARNLLTKLVRYRDHLYSTRNSISVLPALLPILVDAAVAQHTGTLNLVNPGTVTHERILQLYAQHVDPGLRWHCITRAEHDARLLSKRSNNTLDTALLQRLEPGVEGVEEALVRVMRVLGRGGE